MCYLLYRSDLFRNIGHSWRAHQQGKVHISNNRCTYVHYTTFSCTPCTFTLYDQVDLFFSSTHLHKSAASPSPILSFSCYFPPSLFHFCLLLYHWATDDVYKCQTRSWYHPVWCNNISTTFLLLVQLPSSSLL